MGFHLKLGDRVRVIQAPPVSLVDDRLNTRALFELCVGRVFSVVGFNGDLLELGVGEVLGKSPSMDSIWIEREFVEMVEATS